jgi:hypothetical protein
MKSHAILIILIVLLVALVGCENDTHITGPQDTILTFSSNKALCAPPSQELMDSLDYEEFSTLVMPGEGGWLTAEMASWPRGSLFSINIPPTAVPDNGGEPVEFSMSIPTFESYMEHDDECLPLIIRLEPSNVMFQTPVTVMATYMPWVSLKQDDLYNLKTFTYAPEIEEHGTPAYFFEKKMLRVMFQTWHFSTWGVGGGI